MSVLYQSRLRHDKVVCALLLEHLKCSTVTQYFKTTERIVEIRVIPHRKVFTHCKQQLSVAIFALRPSPDSLIFSIASLRALDPQ